MNTIMIGKESTKSDFTMNEVMTPDEIEKAKDNLMEEIMDSAIERYKKEKEILKYQRKKVWKYYKSLSKKERKELINKFLIWEKSYEDFWYMERQTQTTSHLWTIFYNIIMKKGKDVTEKYWEEDFLGSAYQYKKWTLKTYCGQGCFDRLFYKNEEIFQTT